MVTGDSWKHAEKLGEEDEAWIQDSIGDRYPYSPWQPSDTLIAAGTLLDLQGPARMLLGILVSSPGKVFSSAEVLRFAPAVFGSRRKLLKVDRMFKASCKRWDRRLPFSRWDLSNGDVLFGMRPSLCQLFGKAEQLVGQIEWVEGDYREAIGQRNLLGNESGALWGRC